jgi:hypothetical protein
LFDIPQKRYCNYSEKNFFLFALTGGSNRILILGNV